MTTGDPNKNWPRSLIRRLARVSRPHRDRLARFSGVLLRRDILPDNAAFHPRQWDSYAAWMAVNTDTLASFQDIEHALTTYERQPLISVVMPIHNSNLRHLRAAIESVLAQTYSSWELCIIDDRSDSGAALALAETLAQNEPRIRTGRLTAAGGISASTNAAAGLATGEILAFLDHDDLLAPTALAETALLYLQRPDLDLAYSDDDKITEDGVRHAPQFKPSWSPNLLLSYMYFGHLMTVRRDFFTKLGGFRTEFDGSQDYDFSLRAGEQARAVGHVPRVLYHWRVSAGSTAASGDAKPGAIAAARRALQEALERRRMVGYEVVQTAWGRKHSLGLFELRLSETRAAVAYLPWDATVHDLRKALDSLNGKPVALIDPSLEATSSDWVSQAAGRLSFNGVACVSAQISVDGLVRRGGLTVSDDGTITPLFYGQRQDNPGYMSLNATAREVAATNSGALVTQEEHLSRYLVDRDATESFSELDYTLWLTSRGHRCLLMSEFLASASTEEWRPQSTVLRDPYANPNLNHLERPYQIRPVHSPSRMDRPIRVAFLSHNLSHEGASITLRDVVIGLRAKGVVTPTIITPRPGALSADYAAVGIDVIVAPELAPLATATEHNRAVTRLSEILKAEAIELVTANTVRMTVGVSAAASLSLPSILCQHESEPWQSYYNYMEPKLRPTAYAAFSEAYAVVHMSNATLEAWRPLLGRGNGRVIRNVLPDTYSVYQDRAAARRRLAVSDDELVFLIVGTVCERKRQLDAVRAFRCLPEDVKSRSRLILVGHTPEAAYAEWIRNEITAGALESSVILAGGVPSTKPYFSAADVYICTSQFESSPRVLLQAMDYKLPILTTSVFGIREMTTEHENALYFNVGAHAELCELMIAMVRYPESRTAMAKASAKVAKERPSYDTMLSQYAQVLREALLSSIPTA